MLRILLLSVVVITGLAACGGSTEPVTPPLALTLSPDTVVVGVRAAQADGSTLITCYYDIAATVSGGHAGDVIVWDGGSGYFADSTGATASTFTLGQTDLVSWFGSDRIVTGSRVTAALHSYWSQAPFTTFFSFRYHLPTGEQRAATWRIHCQ